MFYVEGVMLKNMMPFYIVLHEEITIISHELQCFITNCQYNPRE